MIRQLIHFVLLFQLTLANRIKFSRGNSQVCAGMYSKEDWGGKVQPFISVRNKKGSYSVVIFDYSDMDFIGHWDDAMDPTFICDESAIENGYCDESQLNTFIVQESLSHNGEDVTPKAEIITFYSDSEGIDEHKYSVLQSGYYCVATIGDDDYEGVINFRNAFGQLAAAEVNKLPLYGLLGVFYLVAFAFYAFAFWKHKHELLPLQKYLMFFFVFLTVDTIFTWAYYDIKNENGDGAGTTAYMIFVSIFNAGKISFSFFLLLVISLGYGVVYPKLNRAVMRKCQALAGVTFAFCLAWLIYSYIINPEHTSYISLIILGPLAICLMVSYFLILTSLAKTTKHLQEQRQMIKLNMYKALFRTIIASLVVLVMGLALTMFVLLAMNNQNEIEAHWRTRFFFTDFWPSLVYYFVFVFIAWVWRPTSTSYMLAVSQQLPTDPGVTDFDLDDMQSNAAEELNFSSDEETPNNHHDGRERDHDLV